MRSSTVFAAVFAIAQLAFAANDNDQAFEEALEIAARFSHHDRHRARLRRHRGEQKFAQQASFGEASKESCTDSEHSYPAPSHFPHGYIGRHKGHGFPSTYGGSGTGRPTGASVYSTGAPIYSTGGTGISTVTSSVTDSILPTHAGHAGHTGHAAHSRHEAHAEHSPPCKSHAAHTAHAQKHHPKPYGTPKSHQTPKPHTSHDHHKTPSSATKSSTMSPSQYSTIPPDDTYQMEVLQYHNIHRANHSAPPLTWNQDLANIASTIAQSCVFGHNVAAGGGGYGQNIAAGTPAHQVGAAISNEFYTGEEPLFGKLGLYGEANPTDDFGRWGHFTQLVWKDTQSVGCATQHCPGGVGKTGGGVEPYFTVCNYEKPGNVEGEYAKNVLRPLGKASIHVSG